MHYYPSITPIVTFSLLKEEKVWNQVNYFHGFFRYLRGQFFLTLTIENVVKFMISLAKAFIQALDKIMKTVYFIKNLIGTNKIVKIQV